MPLLVPNRETALKLALLWHEKFKDELGVEPEVVGRTAVAFFCALNPSPEPEKPEPDADGAAAVKSDDWEDEVEDVEEEEAPEDIYGRPVAWGMPYHVVYRGHGRRSDRLRHSIGILHDYNSGSGVLHLRVTRGPSRAEIKWPLNINRVEYLIPVTGLTEHFWNRVVNPPVRRAVEPQ